MVAWYSKSIIRSSSASFFHWHPLTVCLMRRSRSAVVSNLSCLKSARYMSLKCQNEVDCSKLFSNTSHTCSTFLRSSTLSSRVSQRLYASSPPATSIEGPLSLLRDLVCHEDHIHLPLEGSPCGYLVCCSPVHLRILLPWDRRHDFCN